MNTWIYIYIYVYTHTCIPIYTRAYMRMCVCVKISTGTAVRSGQRRSAGMWSGLQQSSELKGLRRPLGGKRASGVARWPTGLCRVLIWHKLYSSWKMKGVSVCRFSFGVYRQFWRARGAVHDSWSLHRFDARRWSWVMADVRILYMLQESRAPGHRNIDELLRLIPYPQWLLLSLKAGQTHSHQGARLRV